MRPAPRSRRSGGPLHVVCMCEKEATRHRNDDVAGCARGGRPVCAPPVPVPAPVPVSPQPVYGAHLNPDPSTRTDHVPTCRVTSGCNSEVGRCARVWTLYWLLAGPRGRVPCIVVDDRAFYCYYDVTKCTPSPAQRFQPAHPSPLGLAFHQTPRPLTSRTNVI